MTELSSPSGTPILQLERVSKRYGQSVVALDHVTLNVVAGEFTAIMGPSGSGKSTLMHVAAGLDSVSDGRILIDGIDITRTPDRGLTELRRRKVGFVFQSFNLVPTLDVAENIALPITLDGRRPSGAESQWIATLVNQLGLRDRLQHRPAQLSGGQQQRVAIARALATRPAVIFADEPTGALDSRTGREVLAILRRATSSWGQTVVMVTHDPIAAATADRVVFLADGRIEADHSGLDAASISSVVLGLETAA
ncbi:ABC transporter ATP-binding protein [Curtobacterium ammoniigenes]|uniref:ABC transporter ATP-binding protein n=1 Tax=Curtobacterium ammoniigenes TaxID=395387 RepID=UPI0008364AF9|nr:ABC transporter ATP-binding protein [Curtobacterium ammoniigenes]